VIELLNQAAGEVAHDRQFADGVVGTPEEPGIEKVSGSEAGYFICWR
jgi:hypothetical protein